MTWIYEKALKRANDFHIEGVTYNLTLGVVKRVIPAVASTNAIIAAACAQEALKILTKFSVCLNTYMLYNGRQGATADVVANEKKAKCLVCSVKVQEVKISSDSSLEDFILQLKSEFQLQNPTIMGAKGIVYDGNPQFVADFKKELPKTFSQLIAEKSVSNPDELSIVTKAFLNPTKICLIIEDNENKETKKKPVELNG